jgi:hypothetical protein
MANFLEDIKGTNMLKILNRNHMMIDVETLSVKQNAVIVQIAGVAFNVKDGITDTFTVNIDSSDALKYNCVIDRDTLEWWMKQPAEVRKSWQVNKRPLKEAMTSFNEWLRRDALLWANGVPFDIGLVRWSLEQCGIERSWHYWDEMDFRTINTFFDYRMPKFNSHNALEDATAQANHLLKFFKEIPDL